MDSRLQIHAARTNLLTGGITFFKFQNSALDFSKNLMALTHAGR